MGSEGPTKIFVGGLSQEPLQSVLKVSDDPIHMSIRFARLSICLPDGDDERQTKQSCATSELSRGAVAYLAGNRTS